MSNAHEDRELISKKDLLTKYGISYGALYRWKRKGLIPEGSSYERLNFKCCLQKNRKKVDNQQKMIQKGVLLSCSYSRSVMLLPEATPDKCPSRCLLSWLQSFFVILAISDSALNRDHQDWTKSNSLKTVFY